MLFPTFFRTSNLCYKHRQGGIDIVTSFLQKVKFTFRMGKLNMIQILIQMFNCVCENTYNIRTLSLTCTFLINIKILFYFINCVFFFLNNEQNLQRQFTRLSGLMFEKAEIYIRNAIITCLFV